MEYFDSMVGPHNWTEHVGNIPKNAEAMVLKALNERRISISNVVIDEGQDFTDAWIEGLRKCTSGKFVVFYDKNQALFQTELPSWFQRAECRLVLKKNCRNTREIGTTAFRVVGSSASNDHAPSGPKPKLHLYSQPKSGRAILRKILMGYLHDRQAGIDPQDIAVLTMRSEKTSEFPRDEWPTGSSDEYHSRNVCFTSVARFKGLEKRIVILIDVDLGRLSEKKYRGFLHLGCSRAIYCLHILAAKPGKEELAKAVEAVGGQLQPDSSLNTLADLLEIDLVAE